MCRESNGEGWVVPTGRSLPHRHRCPFVDRTAAWRGRGRGRYSNANANARPEEEYHPYSAHARYVTLRYVPPPEQRCAALRYVSESESDEFCASMRCDAMRSRRVASRCAI
eukprot:jgi/Psemu1/309450/fgenesh1_kg.513_\